MFISPLSWKTSSRTMIFPDTKQCARGVTKVIGRYFFPTYVYRHLTNKPPNSGGLSYQQSRIRGNVIDRQLGQCCLSSPGSYNTKFLPEVDVFLVECATRGLDLVQTQLVVGSSHWRLATKVDVVLRVRATGAIILVEIKYGCQYRRCATKTGFMRHHRPRINDCKLHQHQLQALLHRTLFLCTFPAQNPSTTHCALVYLAGESCEWIDETMFAVTTVPELILQRTATNLVSRRRKRPKRTSTPMM